jgi:hypothetical protein
MRLLDRVGYTEFVAHTASSWQVLCLYGIFMLRETSAPKNFTSVALTSST